VVLGICLLRAELRAQMSPHLGLHKGHTPDGYSQLPFPK
jgi:hypothetical protein